MACPTTGPPALYSDLHLITQNFSEVLKEPSWDAAPSAAALSLAASATAVARAFPDIPTLLLVPLINLSLAVVAWHGRFRLALLLCCGALALPYMVAFESTFFHAACALSIFVSVWKICDMAGGTAPAHVRNSFTDLFVHLLLPVEYTTEPCSRAKWVPRAAWQLAQVVVGTVLIETGPRLLAAAALPLPTLPAPVEWITKLWLDTWLVFFMLQLPFSASQLALAVLGYTPIEVFRNPLLLATSPADFWGRRWNLLIHGLFKRTIFKPLRARGVPAELAGVSAFVVSGLFHEYAFLAPPAARAMAGGMLTFFLLQAPLVTGEKYLSRFCPASLRAVLGAAPWLCTLLTTLLILPLSPSFFSPLHASGVMREYASFVPTGGAATQTCGW